MTALFIATLNMSITASVVALFVILIRLLLKKAPKIYSYMLWGVVLFRLLCPFSFISSFSLMPNLNNVIPQDIIFHDNPEIQNILYVNYMIEHQANTDASDPLVSDLPLGYSIASRSFLQTVFGVATYIWLCGVAILLLYAVVGYIRLKNRVQYSTLIHGNIYETDQIKTPFVFGFIHPKIYIPTKADFPQYTYIIKHEQFHIKRKDYIVKPVAYFALALHWFNPLMWLSYILMTMDLEMSCDEAVIINGDRDVRRDYTSSLLDLSIKKTSLIYPLAFGESNVKLRIKNVLYFKNPTLFNTVISLLVVAIVLCGFTFNPDFSKFESEKLHNMKANDIASISVYAIPPNISTLIADSQNISEIVEMIKKIEISKSYFYVSNTNGNFINFVINTKSDDTMTIVIYGNHIAINGKWYIADDDVCAELGSFGMKLIGPSIDVKPSLKQTERTKPESSFSRDVNH